MPVVDKQNTVIKMNERQIVSIALKKVVLTESGMVLFTTDGRWRVANFVTLIGDMTAFDSAACLITMVRSIRPSGQCYQ